MKELLQHDFFSEESIKVELVRDDKMQENVIQLRLIVVDPKKRKDRHKENEAIQFDYNIQSDQPEEVAQEMVGSGFISNFEN